MSKAYSRISSLVIIFSVVFCSLSTLSLVSARNRMELAIQKMEEQAKAKTGTLVIGPQDGVLSIAIELPAGDHNVRALLNSGTIIEGRVTVPEDDIQALVVPIGEADRVEENET